MNKKIFLLKGGARCPSSLTESLVPLGSHACQEDSHALSLFFKVRSTEIIDFVLGHVLGKVF